MTELRPEGTKLVRMTLPAPQPAGPDESGKKSRKKDKVRSAWISFVGRILAQIVGAVATVVLGLMLARRVYPPDPAPVGPSPVPGTAAAGAAVTTPVRSGTSIAVLPFADLSTEAPRDFPADAMTEAVITELAGFRDLRVVSRTSVMRYKGEARPLPEIARELGVQAVVEGSVVRAGDRVRVTAQLIDAATDEHIWARSFDRNVKDVLELQGELARAIAQAVAASLAP
jgi:TolB-like protein